LQRQEPNTEKQHGGSQFVRACVSGSRVFPETLAAHQYDNGVERIPPGVHGAVEPSTIGLG
jgi:hypothetical protein